MSVCAFLSANDVALIYEHSVAITDFGMSFVQCVHILFAQVSGFPTSRWYTAIDKKLTFLLHNNRILPVAPFIQATFQSYRQPCDVSVHGWGSEQDNQRICEWWIAHALAKSFAHICMLPKLHSFMTSRSLLVRTIMFGPQFTNSPRKLRFRTLVRNERTGVLTFLSVSPPPPPRPY